MSAAAAGTAEHQVTDQETTQAAKEERKKSPIVKFLPCCMVMHSLPEKPEQGGHCPPCLSQLSLNGIEHYGLDVGALSRVRARSRTFERGELIHGASGGTHRPVLAHDQMDVSF